MNIQKHNSNTGNDDMLFRENRFVRQRGPKPKTPPEGALPPEPIKEGLEGNEYQAEQMYRYFNLAVATREGKLPEFLKNPAYVRMILGLAEVNSANIFWIPEEIRDQVLKYREEWAREREREHSVLVGTLEDVASDTDDSLEEIRDALNRISELEKRIDEMEKGGEEYLDLPEVGKIKTLLEKYDPENQSELIGWRQALIEFSNLNVLGYIEGRKKSEVVSILGDGALKERLEQLDAYKNMKDEDVFTDRMVLRLITNLESKSLLKLSDEDKKTINELLGNAEEEVKSVLDGMIEELGKEESVLIAGGFKERKEYLEKVGGINATAFLASALDGDVPLADSLILNIKLSGREIIDEGADGDEIKWAAGLEGGGFSLIQENVDALIKRVKIDYKTDITDGHVKIFSEKLLVGGKNEVLMDPAWMGTGLDKDVLDNLIPDLYAVWDPSNLFRHLEKKYGINNPTGISIGGLLSRSQMPPELAGNIKNADLTEIGIGTVCRFVEEEVHDLDLEGDEDHRKKAAGILIDLSLAPKEGVDQYEFNEEVLKHAIALLWVGDEVNATTPLTPLEEAEKILQELKDEDTDKTFNVAANQTVLFNKAGRDAFQSKLAAKLDRRAIGAKAKEHLKHMHKHEVHITPLKDRVKLTFREAYALAGEGISVWWAYVKNIPRDFYDPELDPKLLEILNQKRDIKRYRKAIEIFKSAAKSGEKEVNRAYAALEKDRQKKEDDRELARSTATSPKQHNDQVLLLATASAYPMARLAENWVGRPIKVQQTAFWLAMNKGMDEANEYLDGDPDACLKKLSKGERKRLEEYLVGQEEFAEYEGGDILAPMKRKLGLDVERTALKILAETEHEGESIAVGETRFSQWLNNPESARPGLQAILKETGKYPGAKEALIKAFCDKSKPKVEVKDANGEVAFTLTHGKAFRYVRQIKIHLERQSRERKLAMEQLEKRELFKDPLERGFRSGLEMLRETWSGDWVDKAKVVGIIVAGAWLLRDRWKNGGRGWKAAIVGLPLLVAANSAYKKSSNRDLLGEHLYRLSDEERKGAYEQFRRGSKSVNYLLGTNAGHAALRELNNPDNPITINSLLSWRGNIHGKSGDKVYSEGAPSNLDAGRIKRYMEAGSDEDDAYRLAYDAFEALCINVAALNNLSTGKDEDMANEGAKYLKEEYQDKGNGDMSMLDVIIAESKTHSPTSRIRPNLTKLEKAEEMIEAAGDKIWDWAKRQTAKAQVLGREAMHKAEGAYEWGKEISADKYEDIKTWVRLTYPKTRDDVLDNVAGAWQFVAGTAKDAGLIIKNKGPEVIEWGFDSSVGAAKWSKDAVVRLYYGLHSFQIIGQPIDSLVAFCMGEGLDLEEEVKTEEYMRDVLAKPERFIEDMQRHIDKIANAPSEAQLKGWLDKLVFSANEKAITAAAVVRAAAMSGVIVPPVAEKIDEVENSRERMLYFELLKRDIFALLVAYRLKDLKTRAGSYVGGRKVERLKIDWPAGTGTFNEGVAAGVADPEVEEIYNYIRANFDHRSILLLTGDEPTLRGTMENVAKFDPDSFSGTISGWVLKPGILQFFTKEGADSWLLTAANRYYDPLIKNAEKEIEPNKLPENRVLFEQYKAYLDTLFANVMLETTLSGNDPKEMHLHIKDADNFLRHLLARRGKKPKVADVRDIDALYMFGTVSDEDKDKVPATIEDSVVVPVSVMPKEMHNILEDEDVQRFICGAKEEIKSEEESRVTRTIGEIEEANAEIDALSNLNLSANQEDRKREIEENARRLQNASGSRTNKLEEMMLSEITNVDDLLVLSKERDRVSAGKKRENLQHLLDRGVVKVLDKIVGDDTSGIASVDDPAKLLNHPEYDEWEKQLLILFAATNPAGEDELSDVVFSVLVYVAFQGKVAKEVNGKKGIERCRNYFKEGRVKAIAGRELTPPKSSAAKRLFTQGDISRRMVPHYLSTLKERMDDLKEELKE